MPDFTGMNWTRDVPHAFNLSLPALEDTIQGETSDKVPTPTLPSSPLGNTPVYNWGQDIYVGSTTIGAGRRVQSDTLQQYTDHALHTNIVTPNP